jgi:hypothetical protein
MNFNIGDRVKVKTINRVGRIKSVKENGHITIELLKLIDDGGIWTSLFVVPSTDMLELIKSKDIREI